MFEAICLGPASLESRTDVSSPSGPDSGPNLPPDRIITSSNHNRIYIEYRYSGK